MSRPTPDLRTQSRHSEFDAVDPAWLLKALSVTLVVALICAYLAFCLLFYQGQWQLVLHPSRTSSSLMSIEGAPYQVVHFAPDDSGVPQLTGWWIPAVPKAPYANATVLFLPGADGSLSGNLPALEALHGVGINVFAFDYRGYGQSKDIHPNQQRMLQDAESAWKYLSTSREIPPGGIVLFAVDLGASLAAQLALAHPITPALVLNSPRGDLLDAAQRDPRSRLIPMQLLFHERFPLAQPLSSLQTTRILLLPAGSTSKTSELGVELAPFLNRQLSTTAAQQ